MNEMFGTDGIRGTAGEYPMDYSCVCALGRALILLLQENELPPRILIGRDTRESGGWLEQALFQGARSAGGEAVSCGVIPTSAISYLTLKHAFSAGVVISASHNPYQDNGLKIFSSKGMKISYSWEKHLEDAVSSSAGPVTRELVDIHPTSGFHQEYMDFLISRFHSEPDRRRLKVIVDCAQGAASHIAPEVLSRLGFEVMPLNASPDGRNINAGCGSLHPGTLAQTVLDTSADLGIALDGDADRALWVDESGRILNGDHTLFVLARHMKDQNHLTSDCIISTAMSNIGLERALAARGIHLYRAAVGDRFVLEQMIEKQTNLGGEQSGHTIFLDDCPTGDGILTSLKMLEVMQSSGLHLSELVADFREYPQILLNIPVSRKEDFARYPEITARVREAKSQLGDSGRVHLRYSGTEPVARVMIEGPDAEDIAVYADKIAREITKYLG